MAELPQVLVQALMLTIFVFVMMLVNQFNPLSKGGTYVAIKVTAGVNK